MHPGVKMLEEVIDLSRRELELMDLEDAAALGESAARRGSLLKEAWQVRPGCDEAEFVSRLLVVQELQRKLAAEAEKKLGETRDALNRQTKSRKAVLGYCKTGAGYSGKKSPRMVTKKS